MILESRDGAVLTLTMNRPEKRNALSGDLVVALTEALRRAGDDPSVRVVVLTGAGTVFSAGADLAALQALATADFDTNLADSRRLAELFDCIHTLAVPVVAKVNGHAIAGGCGLAAVCDFSIVADHAKLGFTETRIGFVPAIVAVYVTRKVSEADVRDLFIRGHLITAAEASALRLVTRSVPSDQLDAEVEALCAEIASETSRSAVALTKRLLAELPGKSGAEALAYASNVNAEARGTDDCRAGVRAFLDKEPPPWKGGRSGC